MNTLRTGTADHKEAFCKAFVRTHEPYEADRLVWPDLDADAVARLKNLPVWDEAVYTERETALKVQSLAKAENDPVLREAIALQGFEEARHSRMLELLTARYGIEVSQRPDPLPPADAEWAFMRTGYGECFDSFFAFGLFSIAKESGFFPPALVTMFDPIMQEEARHILFFANWVAYERVQLPAWKQAPYAFRRALAISLQVLSRLRTAIHVGNSNPQDNFAMKSHGSFGEISPRSFLELCLSENERRLSLYDRELLRPQLVPSLARFVLKVLPSRRRAIATAA